MDQKTVLYHLEDLARRIGLEIRYERLDSEEAEVGSGRFRLRGQDTLIMDRRLDAAGRIKVLSRELRASDLTGVFVKPFLRSLLGLEDED